LLDVTAFGALVRQKRGQKRLTQETLATDVFGDAGRKGDISRIENGRTNPQEATVQKLCTALDISDAEMLAIRQSRPSAAQLDQIPTLSREELQNLAARFQIADAFDQPDAALREVLTQKAKEYRSYRATIDALDDRVAAIANLKGAAQDAAAKLDFDEVEALLARVDEVETEIAAETKVARAKNALLRNDPDTAFRLLSAAADSFRSIDRWTRRENAKATYGPPLPARPALPRRRAGPRRPDDARRAEGRAPRYGRRIFGRQDASRTTSAAPSPDLGARAGDTAALQDAVTAYRAALEVFTREASPMDWAMTQNNLGNALRDLGARAGDTAALQDAVTAYRAALEVYTREASPMDWAMTQNNLGAALQDADLGVRAGDTAALRDAVAAYRAALEVRTREASPMDWAGPRTTSATPSQPRRPRGRHRRAAGRRHRLPRRAGGLHAGGQPDALGHDPEQPRQRPPDLGARAGDTDALQDAVTAYRAALEVRTREAAPFPPRADEGEPRHRPSRPCHPPRRARPRGRPCRRPRRRGRRPLHLHARAHALRPRAPPPASATILAAMNDTP
jgi:transcriptional regulator with XRE-family HTH domain